MSARTVPLSVRVSMEDAEYISGLSIPGAVTPSEKLRAIISNARQRSEGQQDYEGCMKNTSELVAPVSLRLKGLEHTHRLRSELLAKVIEWNQETLAFVMANVPHEAMQEEEATFELLKSLEEGVADRAIGFVMEVMRMGITKKSNCYEPETISSRLEEVLEVARVISGSRG